MVDPSPVWGVFGVGVLMLLAVLGVPIAASMGIVGFAMMVLFYGDLKAVVMTASTFWFQAASYTLSLLPLFILMGEIAGRCELGKDAFDCFYKFMNKIRGALAIVSTVSCAFFGAISGSNAGTIATIGGIALPIMRRYGYKAELRTGTIAVAGILSNLIPPSIMAVIYCTLTEQPIAKVFIAGVIPGIIFTAMIAITVLIQVKIRPQLASISTETFTLREKVKSLKGLIPIMAIFLFLFGGIYIGLFSPTEAAAVGVIATAILTLCLRRLTWSKFNNALNGTLITTAFIMLLIIGAVLFAKAIALTKLANAIADVVVGMDLPPVFLIGAIAVMFLLFGCVLDAVALLVLLVPLWYPTVIAIGCSPIWFGIFSIILVEIGLITPPIASNIYVAQAADGEATTLEVIRGILPFYFVSILLVVLLIIFPELSTWLPSTMR
jgi:tripartite ATP-independent transporter DctM subunit